MECIYPGKTLITLKEASAVFTNDINALYWQDINFPRPNCETRISNWNVLQLNYVFMQRSKVKLVSVRDYFYEYFPLNK